MHLGNAIALGIQLLKILFVDIKTLKIPLHSVSNSIKFYVTGLLTRNIAYLINTIYWTLNSMYIKMNAVLLFEVNPTHTIHSTENWASCIVLENGNALKRWKINEYPLPEK